MNFFKIASFTKKNIVQIVQIALTFAIIVNVLNIIHNQTEKIDSFTGIDEENIIYVTNVLFNTSQTINERITIDLDIIKNIPNVVDVTITNSVPLASKGWSVPVHLQPTEKTGGVEISAYMVDSHAINTLGLNLIAGKNFSDVDQINFKMRETNWAPKIILTKKASEELFGKIPSFGVGSLVYIDGKFPSHVVGIIEKLQGPWADWEEGLERSMLLPQTFIMKYSQYLIRVKDGLGEDMLKTVKDALMSDSTGRYIIGPNTFSQNKKKVFHREIITIKILLAVLVIFIFVSMFGIAGLTINRIQNKSKELHIKKAVGASLWAIHKEIVLNNLNIIILSSVIGIILSLFLNQYLISNYSATYLSIYHLFLSLIIIIGSGQVATLFTSYSIVKKD